MHRTTILPCLLGVIAMAASASAQITGQVSPWRGAGAVGCAGGSVPVRSGACAVAGRCGADGVVAVVAAQRDWPCGCWPWC